MIDITAAVELCQLRQESAVPSTVIIGLGAKRQARHDERQGN